MNLFVRTRLSGKIERVCDITSSKRSLIKEIKTNVSKLGNLTKTEARVKMQSTFNKNTIVFPVEYNPRRPNVNAIVKLHGHLLHNSTFLFIAANKRANKLGKSVAGVDRFNIKTDLLDQTDTAARNVVDLAKFSFLGKHLVYVLVQELNLRLAEIVPVMLYTHHTAENVINIIKVLDLASNGNHH